MIPRAFLLLLALLCMPGCFQTGGQVVFHAKDNPALLADWGLFEIANGRIRPRNGMVTYELNTPLFSDYAQKWRTIWMPEGRHARFDANEAFDFPVGTIITKTFYYSVPARASAPGGSDLVLKPTAASYQSGIAGLDLTHVRLIETRLLIRREAGWDAIPYLWNSAQTEAHLARTGAEIPLTLSAEAGPRPFVYMVPNVNQCAGCHATDYRTRKIRPIGLKARHLNRTFPGAGGDINQLRRLVALGYLSGVPRSPIARNANWQDRTAPLEERARAYLDINCSHCHSPTGPARTSGLWLGPDAREPRALGVCKPPVAAGRGAGGRLFDLVPGSAERSILAYRLTSTGPGEMMPELGRTLVHEEGARLVASWIGQMAGSCGSDANAGVLAEASPPG